MNRLTLAQILAILSLVPTATLSQDTPACPMDYDTYEVSVPHTDLEACPASMAVEGAFCRLSLVAEIATIFAFDEDTFCIVAARSYEDDAFTFDLK